MSWSIPACNVLSLSKIIDKGSDVGRLDMYGLMEASKSVIMTKMAYKMAKLNLLGQTEQ